jgi:hypothetical protein
MFVKYFLILYYIDDNLFGFSTILIPNPFSDQFYWNECEKQGLFALPIFVNHVLNVCVVE